VTLVRIVKNWERPDLRRQSPGRTGRWGEIQFTQEPVEECDYLLVINYPNEPVELLCPPENVWMLTMEPPIIAYKSLHAGVSSYARVYTQDETLTGPRYRLSHPALPWQLERDYDQLVHMAPPAKSGLLSCVSSNLAALPGHRARLRFLDRLREQVDFELYGRGFRPIADKWDGVAPFRYSLAIENYACPYYWTEKLADCYLAWTMPIYYGAPNAADFFPAESFVAIDIADPDAPRQVQDVIASNRWRKNVEAIVEARRLVLDRWQLFPTIAGEIEADLAAAELEPEPERIVVPGHLPASFLLRLTPLAYTRPRRTLTALVTFLYGHWRAAVRLWRRATRRSRR
jgi:hypothetical protein